MHGDRDVDIWLDLLEVELSSTADAIDCTGPVHAHALTSSGWRFAVAACTSDSATFIATDECEKQGNPGHSYQCMPSGTWQRPNSAHGFSSARLKLSRVRTQ